nr:manganese efflux pump [Maliibacterium massiliense]
MLESILLVSALAVDAFVVSLAYGARKIRITWPAALIIDAVGTLFLLLALLAAEGIKRVVSPQAGVYIGAGLLALFGVKNLLEGSLKTYLRRRGGNARAVKLTWCDIRIVLRVYLQPEQADMDGSMSISAREALMLAVALSIDSLATGLGSGLAQINILEVVALSALFHLLAVCGGWYVGSRCARVVRGDLSWLSGLLLLALAVSRLF